MSVLYQQLSNQSSEKSAQKQSLADTNGLTNTCRFLPLLIRINPLDKKDDIQGLGCGDSNKNGEHEQV